MAGNETLTSRKRVLKAMNYQEADRVPLDMGGFQTGIHKKAYEALIEYLGLGEDIVILDPVQQLAKPSEAVLEKFHIDTRYVCAHGPDSFKGGIEQNERDGKLWHDLEDEFGVVWSMPDDQQLYMDISHHPVADATVKDLADYPFPNGSDPSRFVGLRERALTMQKEIPYAISSYICG
ncbi:MAG: hypothetical protein KAV87_49950, partial [Desulfobacteraceae bacterium]|nr:hypothetical protein [Desulfobacteraceae bacterium]